MNQTLTGIGKAVAGVGKGAKENFNLLQVIAGTQQNNFLLHGSKTS
ncbi:MAG: hypothetical protein ACLRZG_06925 [Streptococcus sp.]